MAKKLSARSRHDPLDTHDHTEITATDITDINGDLKRGLDANVLGGVQLSGLRTGLSISNISVTTTAAKLPATPLVGRNSMIIYNLGNKSIWLGNADVEASGALEGWEVTPGSYFSLDITDGIEVYALTSSTTQAVKLMELA